ncbi:hypothetical protein DM01DRAFT_78009 [Hesseltinella vesiculosa]|uniref:Uncharacterized protein n=1 Tax=Hesseltinella vesiculosa TaxID=101127 RepID=A0A1X2GAH6_9FUNG|nr:hypothetical protein DM01DRAFT_78009 [Hesseltinella vesiculosa]
MELGPRPSRSRRHLPNGYAGTTQTINKKGDFRRQLPTSRPSSPATPFRRLTLPWLRLVCCLWACFLLYRFWRSFTTSEWAALSFAKELTRLFDWTREALQAYLSRPVP